MGSQNTIDQYWKAYNEHDLDGVLGLLDEDVVIHFPTDPQPILGKEEIRRVWSRLFGRIIPDIHEDVLSTVVQDGTVACEVVESGTLVVPSDPSEALSASTSSSHRPYKMNVAAFFRLNDDGLIERIRSYWDTGAFAKQIGIDIGLIRSMQSRARAL